MADNNYNVIDPRTVVIPKTPGILVSPIPTDSNLTPTTPPNGPNAVTPLSNRMVTAPVINPTLPTYKDPSKMSPSEMPFTKRMSDLVPYNPPNVPWWKNLLYGIAGGFAGAAGHPEMGLKINPTNRYNEQWQNRIATLTPLYRQEQEGLIHQNQLSYDTANMQNNIARENAILEGQANTSNARTQHNLEQEQEARQREIDKAKDYESLASYREKTLKQKEESAKQKAANPPKTTLEKNYEAAENLIQQYQKDHPGASRKDAMSYYQELGTMTSLYNNPLASGQAAGARAQADLNVKSSPEYLELQRKLEQQKLDTQQQAKQEFIKPILDQFNSLSQDPTSGKQTQSEFVAALPPSIKAELYKSPDFQAPFSLSKEGQQQLSIGRAALNHVTSVEQLLQDPDIQRNLGALSGRITLAKQYIGGDPYDKNGKFTGTIDPIVVNMSGVDPNSKEQRFLTDVSNLLNWEVKNIAGNRPAHQLFDRLQKNAPSTVKGIFSNIGSLQGIKDGIINAMDGFLGKVHTSASDQINSNGEKKKPSEIYKRVEVNKP